MHTTVKKFLNSLVPPFIDPNFVPEEASRMCRLSIVFCRSFLPCAQKEINQVDKNWGNYKYAQPQKVHLKAGDLPLENTRCAQYGRVPLFILPLPMRFSWIPGFTFQSFGGTPCKARDMGPGPRKF